MFGAGEILLLAFSLSLNLERFHMTSGHYLILSDAHTAATIYMGSSSYNVNKGVSGSRRMRQKRRNFIGKQNEQILKSIPWVKYYLPSNHLSYPGTKRYHLHSIELRRKRQLIFLQ